MTIKWSYLGLTEYEKALILQHELREQVVAGGDSDYLLLLQHPSVVTRGYSERGDSGLLESRERFAAEGIKIIDVDRGGKTTFHGPDQLVGYFIFDLNRLKLKPRQFIEGVAHVLMIVLDSYGIEAQYNEQDPGVETEKGKLAFLGFNIQKGITTHGFSLNVGKDIQPFTYIVPCGKMNRKITSMELITGLKYSFFDVYWRFITAFGEVFKLRLDEVSVEDDILLR
ncbi:MAG TPA: lipoyl(octanoyl) transferase LipB [bacterium]|nr:lipoyl(octanoyl) transferase LipB [bacterium]